MTGQWEPGTIVRIAEGCNTGRVGLIGRHSGGEVVPVGLPDVDGDIAVLAYGVSTLRPLMVLDLPNGALAGWPVLIDAFKKAREATGFDMTFTSLIEQIEAQTKPAKPAEPTGLGAVVEDAEGLRWVQARDPKESGGAGWRSWPVGMWKHYSEIAAVRVLSEGVTA